MSLTLLLDVVSGLALGLGVAFALIGAVGLLRLPDVFARMHGAGLIDTMAVFLIIFGLLLQVPSWTVAAKLVLIVVFILFTSPTATHALARAALHGGVTPKVAGGDDAEGGGNAPSKA